MVRNGDAHCISSPVPLLVVSSRNKRSSETLSFPPPCPVSLVGLNALFPRSGRVLSFTPRGATLEPCWASFFSFVDLRWKARYNTCVWLPGSPENLLFRGCVGILGHDFFFFYFSKLDFCQWHSWFLFPFTPPYDPECFTFLLTPRFDEDLFLLDHWQILGGFGNSPVYGG